MPKAHHKPQRCTADTSQIQRLGPSKAILQVKMRQLVPSGATNLSLPADSYIYKLCYQPQGSGEKLLAAISSDDSLRLLSPSTLQTLAGGVFANTHEKGVTCLKSGPVGSFVTAGRDGAVRIWDFRERKKVLELRGGIQIKWFPEPR